MGLHRSWSHGACFWGRTKSFCSFSSLFHQLVPSVKWALLLAFSFFSKSGRLREEGTQILVKSQCVLACWPGTGLWRQTGPECWLSRHRAGPGRSDLPLNAWGFLPATRGVSTHQGGSVDQRSYTRYSTGELRAGHIVML